MTLSYEDNQARISVHNEGNELTPEEQHKVFDSYYRSPDSTAQKGWGLGLTIVQSVAKAHGGTAEVKSAEGKGTTFSIVMPVEKGF